VCCLRRISSARGSPRRRAASLVGPLRPGRRNHNLAVAGRSIAGSVRRKLLSALLLAHRRQREAARRRCSCTAEVRGRARRRRRCPAAALSEGTHHDVSEAIQHCARATGAAAGFHFTRPGRRVPPRAMTATPGVSSRREPFPDRKSSSALTPKKLSVQHTSSFQPDDCQRRGSRGVSRSPYPGQTATHPNESRIG
jgi:hypothetical protein